MDAKLTPEQAIEILKSCRYEYVTEVTNDGKDVHIPTKQIAALIESLVRDAENGRKLAKAVYQRQQIEYQVDGAVIPFEEADGYLRPLNNKIDELVKKLGGEPGRSERG